MKIIFQFFYFLGLISLLSCQQSALESTSDMNNTSLSIANAKLENWEIENSVRALEVIDENTIWYAGSKSTYAYTTDGGKTWYIDSLKVDNKVLEFRAIAATDSALFLISIVSPTYLFKTTDFGKNWKIVYQENDSLSFYNSMKFTDNLRGVATGDPIGGCLSIIITKDGGNTWSKIPCSKLPPSEEGEAEFAASNTNISVKGDNIWIATGGSKARVFHSTDFGDSWSVIQTPIIEGGQMTGVYSIDFYDNSNGIIFGGDWNEKTRNDKNKAITTDSGKSWTLVADSLTPGYQSCVQYISDKDLISVGSTGINFSTDGGLNWQELSKEGFYTVRISPNRRTAWLAGNKKLGKLSW